MNHTVTETRQGHSEIIEIKVKGWPKGLCSYEKYFFKHPGKFDVVEKRLQKTGQFKIFLSSPFDGCSEERDRFMKTQLPVLEKLLTPLGVYVSVVDMRWGITNRMGRDDLTLEACLNALDDCDIFIGFYSSTRLADVEDVLLTRISQVTYIWLGFCCHIPKSFCFINSRSSQAVIHFQS